MAFDPQQPRVPAGQPGGGQWAAGSSAAFKEALEAGDEKRVFKVLEDRGDRVLVEEQNSMNILPTRVLLKQELKILDTNGDAAFSAQIRARMEGQFGVTERQIQRTIDVSMAERRAVLAERAEYHATRKPGPTLSASNRQQALATANRVLQSESKARSSQGLPPSKPLLSASARRAMLERADETVAKGTPIGRHGRGNG